MKIMSFDIARFFAIMFIVMCHYLANSGLNYSLGVLFGSVGNCMFFVLSAFLFGFKWSSNHKNRFGSDFIIGRFMKLAASLYPFLFLLIISFIIAKVDFEWFDIIMNYLFLGWFAKLPANGHLWFLTILIICYSFFLLFSTGLLDRFANKWAWGGAVFGLYRCHVLC